MKVLRFLMSVLTASVFVVGTLEAGVVIEKPVPIKIGGKIAEIKELDVRVRNVADNLDAVNFDFTIGNAPDWVVSNQYILVDFKANYPEYGIHLLTKNKDNIVPPPGKTFVPKILGLGLDGLPNTPDDIISYGGLIDPATCDNPTARADLAWRAYDKHLGNNVFPAIVKDNRDNIADPNEVSDSAANWKSDWKYTGDKDNTEYDLSFVRKENPPGSGTYEYNYLMCAFGYANGVAHTAINTQGVITLTNADPASPNKDVALYIGASLGGLPAGDYGTQMYVQLINE